MQQKDLIYCDEPSCKELSKIQSTIEDHTDNHYGHKLKKISVLRAELLENQKETNPIRILTTNEKEDLMRVIDQRIDSLQKLFNQTLLDFGKRLKMFVNDNLVSLKSIQLLFQAVLDDNQELIKEHQSELQYLTRDTKYFADQDLISKDINEKLVKALESAKDEIQKLNEIILEKPITQALPSIKTDVDQSFRWSSLNKHESVIVDGLSISHVTRGHNFILIDPQLNFQSTQTVSLRMTKISDCFLSICDLKVVKVKAPDFQNIYQQDFGSYSHWSYGQIYATDTCGSCTTSCFTFAQGDILDLQWNGPQKTFTTIKRSTGEKFEFTVTYNADSEIYFGVGMDGVTCIDII